MLGQATGIPGHASSPLLLCLLCGSLGIPEFIGITWGKRLAGEMGVCWVCTPLLSALGSVLGSWAGAEEG